MIFKAVAPPQSRKPILNRARLGCALHDAPPSYSLPRSWPLHRPGRRSRRPAHLAGARGHQRRRQVLQPLHRRRTPRPSVRPLSSRRRASTRQQDARRDEPPRRRSFRTCPLFGLRAPIGCAGCRHDPVELPPVCEDQLPRISGRALNLGRLARRHRQVGRQPDGQTYRPGVRPPAHRRDEGRHRAFRHHPGARHGTVVGPVGPA